MDFKVYVKDENTHASVSELSNEAGILYARLDVVFDTPAVPSPVTVRWNYPMTDILCDFNVTNLYDRSIAPSWRKRTTSSRLASGAPLQQLISHTGRNRMTVALSDAATPCSIGAGIVEKTAELECDVVFFTQPVNTLESYSAVMRIDMSDIPYEAALKSAERWWEESCGYPSAYIPDSARKPLYSCWYSFHKNIDIEAIVNQCRLAKAMGMENVIVDDGWQCNELSGGYSYCGDWEPEKSKVSDMKAFVDRVHETGMKFILWYSVPAMGVHAANYERFRDMLLNPSSTTWASLDPRFPEVRRFLCSIYKKAAEDWGLDGFKLDFIDSFRLFPDTPAFDERWDTLSLEEGVDRLLSEVSSTLRAINPEMLIEFRQSYFGPVIKKYGNMIRVGDCPNDAVRNRVGGIDLRFLLGKTAVHSDMLMWNVSDSVEAAAAQVISTLFLVPQISVLLDKIPEAHRRMLNFYLDFWNRHRDTLLDGCLSADDPGYCYSLVKSEKDGETIAVSYTRPVLSVHGEDTPYSDRLFFVNASSCGRLFIDSEAALGSYAFRILTPCGDTVAEGNTFLGAGVTGFDVPVSGMLELIKN
ncbi:MAG: alpha-galactosidase [Clostridia bacterium]|nr:alpha-galactosidase [Clostridia bacterium]